MNYDIQEVPFSMKGSYLAVSKIPENSRGNGNKEGVYLRSIHGLAYMAGYTMGSKPMFSIRITPVWNDTELEYELSANESEVRMTTAHGEIKICFADVKTILVFGSGSEIEVDFEIFRGHAIETGMKEERHFYAYHNRISGRKFLFTEQHGSLFLDPSQKGPYVNKVRMKPDDNGQMLVGIEEVADEWVPGQRHWCYEECRENIQKNFESFLSSMPEGPEEYSEARRLAAYIDWSCIVRKNGFLMRDGMLMAKNWMCSIWSWDHCFNAIALSYNNPAMAWDQFMIMFDHQSESGCIPNSINNTYYDWIATKPPIHGWALNKMMENMQLTESQYREAYDKLSQWTQWWINCRDEDNDGICSYYDGCDSGWDNSTAFKETPFMEVPDLSAFLILQMEVLAKLARKLGLLDDAESWEKKADKMFQTMLDHNFDGVKPKAVVSRTHEVVENDSLIMFLPIVLGQRLPKEIREYLLSVLKSDKFLTENGLATESINSPLYVPDGYWRGPIWAPSTMLLVDGINSCGDREFAVDVVKRFCNMAAKNGFAENYDALTGEGLRDRAYTWTSSVFMILEHEYLFK